MTEHTPGPWQMFTHKVADDLGCLTSFSYVGTKDGPSLGIVVYNTQKPERMANARLIAAAPELLAYAEHMASIGNPDAIELVEKATGRQLTADKS